MKTGDYKLLREDPIGWETTKGAAVIGNDLFLAVNKFWKIHVP
jgi:hypothetical protein